MKSTGPFHVCCPKEWRGVHSITGHHELDALIENNDNPDIPHRLAYYLDRPTNSYGPVTAYNGYSNYSGDS
jgi:hypothetical protein